MRALALEGATAARDDDQVGAIVRGPPGKNEVDALGRLRNSKLDADAHVVGHLVIAQYLGHLAEGLALGVEFGIGRITARGRQVAGGDDILDVTVVRVAQEAGLGGLVDDQWTGLAMRTG